MTLLKIRLGTHEDRSPLYHYQSDGHVVITGPISGTVTTKDGKTYDVTDHVIEVDSKEHAEEVADLIGERHQTEGHPKHPAGQPQFVHTPGGSKAALKILGLKE